MVNPKVSHIQINIDPQNIPFYRELLTFLGWDVWVDEPRMLGVGNKEHQSLWFLPAKAASNDYDGPGMNHLGIGVASQSDIDEAASYLQEHGVKALFETPRHRPEFSSGPDQTYYQVMFESPDRVLFEVVYIGPKK